MLNVGSRDNTQSWDTRKSHLGTTCIYSSCPDHEWTLSTFGWIWTRSDLVHMYFHCNPITVTSQWLPWRLKSPALGCLFNRLFKLTPKKTSKPALLALCEGNSPVTGEFPGQKASNAEKASIWWRHHAIEAWDKRVAFCGPFQMQFLYRNVLYFDPNITEGFGFNW